MNNPSRGNTIIIEIYNGDKSMEDPERSNIMNDNILAQVVVVEYQLSG